MSSQLHYYSPPASAFARSNHVHSTTLSSSRELFSFRQISFPFRLTQAVILVCCGAAFTVFLLLWCTDEALSPSQHGSLKARSEYGGKGAETWRIMSEDTSTVEGQLNVASPTTAPKCLMMFFPLVLMHRDTAKPSPRLVQNLFTRILKKSRDFTANLLIFVLFV